MRKIAGEAIKLKQSSLTGLENIPVKDCFCLPSLCKDLFSLEVSCSVEHMYFTEAAGTEMFSVVLQQLCYR